MNRIKVGASTELKNFIINQIFVGSDSPLGLVYLALCAPVVSNELEDTVTEINGKNYRREALYKFMPPRCGELALREDVIFNRAKDDWGIVSHIALYSAMEGGILLGCGPLKKPTYVRKGRSAVIPKGSEVFIIE